MNMDAREHNVEQWLDDALTHYGKVEARPGLEKRVLANLHVAEARIVAGRRWWWAAGMVAATSAIVVIVWFVRADQPGRTPATSVAVRHEGEGVSTQASAQLPVQEHVGKEVRRPVTQRIPRELRAVGPKLERFPAPAPLCDQERMLARYVREFPQKAALTAQVQTELRKQDELEMAAPWPSRPTTGSEQLE